MPYHESVFNFSYPGIGRGLTFMTIQGLLFFGILAFIESNLVYVIRGRIAKKRAKTEKHVENDLLEVAGDEIASFDLSKQYGMTRAVSRLTFGVSQGDVLVAVGVNGAGKSSLLKLLTGEESVTGGDALISGVRISQNKNRVRAV